MLRSEDLKNLFSIDQQSEYKDTYSHIKTSSVASQSRIFNQVKLNKNQCLSLLSKIVFLLNHGERFTDNQKTEVFFNVTKLFQSDHQKLRRLLYVFIKELNAKQHQAFIVISSLQKDINSKVVLFRSNALRTLARVIDPQLHLQGIQRFIKNAIIDTNPAISNAALIFGLRLVNQHPNIVSRWSSDLQEKLKDPKTFFLAILLFSKLKINDLMSIIKIILGFITANSSFRKTMMKSKLGMCQLVQIIKKILIQSASQLDTKTKDTLLGYLNSLLENQDQMLKFEAAKSLIELDPYYAREVEIESVFVVFQEFLLQKPVKQYAGLRMLNKMARTYPKLVTMAYGDIEPLLSDGNRFVASLAVSTLLQTCDEKSVEKLLNQIKSYLSDMGDDFKIQIINSLCNIAIRMPRKSQTFINFLTQTIPPYEGSLKSRRACVDAIYFISKLGPSAKMSAMIALAQFIQDCNSTSLTCQVISILSEQVPYLQDPQIFIQSIYNRIVLENPQIRASAASALAKIAHKIQSLELKQSILHLLQGCTCDVTDDELREQTRVFYIALKDEIQEKKKGNEIIDFAFGDRTLDLNGLEKSLMSMVEDDVKDVNLEELIQQYQVDTKDSLAMAELNKDQANDRVQDSATLLPQIEQQNEGDLLSSRIQLALNNFKETQMFKKLQNPEVKFTSKETSISDKDGEYHVSVIKHYIESQNCLILQYLITNTFQTHILKHLNMDIQLIEDQHSSTISVEQIEKPPKDFQLTTQNSPAYIYALIRSKDVLQSGPLPTGAFKNQLQMKISQDGSKKFYGDHYDLQDLLLTASDYMEAVPLNPGEHQTFWESLSSSPDFIEGQQSYSIPGGSLTDQVSKVIKYLGMSVCDGSDKIQMGAKGVRVYLSGRFFGKIATLASAVIWKTDESGDSVMLQLDVRTRSNVVVKTLLNSIS